MLFCIGTGEPGAPAPAEGGGSVLRLLSNQNFNPTRLIVVSFGAIILLGTFLLHLPISARDGQFTPWLTCLFTATSATCVTGLVLVDSALHWTPFGQGVILAMIQLGGLGFVSLISLIPLLLRRRIGLSQRLAIASGLEFMGVKMDAEANNVRGKEAVISAPDSKVKVLLIPTNEELMIATDTAAIVSGK